MTSLSPARLEQIKKLLYPTEFRDAALTPLAGDASFRRYIRVQKDNKSAMLMDAPPDKEDGRPFIAIAEHLVTKGYSAPTILARDVAAGLLLLEDLGDDSFTSLLKTNPASEEELYAAAVDLLAAWHDRKVIFADNKSLALPAYDEALLMREIELFSDWFLPQITNAEQASSLRADYLQLWRDILHSSSLATDIWVHRDYHADNLMWLPERDKHQRVGLLDFQDGVYGDGAYDLVSLLEDARRDVPRNLARAMIDRYIAASGADRKRFETAYAILAAQRNSKIVGIFTRLAVRDHKKHYLNYLPRVWRHLEHDLAHPALAKLKVWTDKHVPADKRGVISVREKLIA